MRGEHVIMAIGLVVVAVVLTVLDASTVRLWDEAESEDTASPDGAA
jgi:hypothetical protein